MTALSKISTNLKISGGNILFNLFNRLLADDPKLSFLKHAIVFGTFFAILFRHLLFGFTPDQDELFFDYLFTIPVLLSSLAFGWKVSVPMASLLIILHMPVSVNYLLNNQFGTLLKDVVVGTIILCSAFITGLSMDNLKNKYLNSIVEQHMLRELVSEIFLKEEINKEKLSKIMYDDLLQSLAGILYKIEAVSINNRQTQDIGYHLRRTIEEIQTSLFELGQSTLNKFGFKAAVNELIGTFLKNTGVKFDIEITDKDISREDGRVLLKILHECLLNIQKHARASYVNISIKKIGNEITLSVTDNGVGFKLNKDFKQMFGLRAIRERVAMNRGKMKIKSAPSKGTSVAILLHVCSDSNVA